MVLFKDTKLKIDYIRNHYGNDTEKEKALEELEELKVEICNDIYQTEGQTFDRENFIGELADVIVVLEHLKGCYEVSDERLQEEIEFKVNRQLKRIAEEK